MGLLEPIPLRLHAPPGLVLKLSLGNFPGKAWDPLPSCSSRRQHQPESPEAERTRAAQRARKGPGNVHGQQPPGGGGTFREKKRSVGHPRAVWKAQLRCSPQPPQPSRPALTPHWVSQGQDNYSIPVPSSVDAGVIVYALIMT